MMNFFSPSSSKEESKTVSFQQKTGAAAAAAAAAAETPATTTVPLEDDKTVRRSGNARASAVTTAAATTTTTTSSLSKRSKRTKQGALAAGDTPASTSMRDMTLDEQLAYLKTQIQEEKAGKRKLFHSLVKLANELRRLRTESMPMMEQQEYADRNWYEGGMWRAPQVLPGIASQHGPTLRTVATSGARQAISLSDLFFNLVIVTAFTRVGVAISQAYFIDASRLLYFAVFWHVWSKETAYSTRFDTTDLSAQMVTLVSCFAVLFACLSVQAAIDTVDGTRVMIMAAFVAALHCWLHVRVVVTMSKEEETSNTASPTTMGLSDPSTVSTTPASTATASPLTREIRHYCVFNIIMNLLETVVWLLGIFVFSPTSPYRWLVFVAGVLLALRVPRAFLANDFHAACSKRGVLFILLLGFLLQSIVVVASEFFTYQTPTMEHYCFIGAACLMFFCIKLLYVDDSDTLAEDHALLVNRTAGFFFNVGQFALLLSTTIMGSGLNLLTHDYMAATAALPGSAKNMVCGGFSATLFSTFFIKSMHLKRVPTDTRNQCLFVSAFIIQSLVLFIVVGVTGFMCYFPQVGGFLGWLMQSDILLLLGLSVSAFVIVVLSWLDEGVELTLYQTAEDSRAFRVHPFGLWWCLKADVSDDDLQAAMADQQVDNMYSSRRLSALSPLLGSSVVALREMDYQATASTSASHGNASATRMSRSAGDLKHQV